MPTISARLSEEDLAELERVADMLDDDRSTTIRKALEEGFSGVAHPRGGRALPAGRRGDRNLTTQLTAADLRRDADNAWEL